MLVFFSLVGMHAQETAISAKGSVTGKVTDMSGVALPGADVVLKRVRCTCKDCPDPRKCDCCPPQLKIRSDEFGKFSFSVFPGEYSLQVKSGNKSYSEKVEVRPEQNATVKAVAK
jgi:hypothetical protein